MNSELKKVFVLEAVFTAIQVYVGIFVNLYFWKNDTTFESLFLFNGLLGVFGFIGYFAGTLSLLKNRPKTAYYGSAISSVMLFLVLLNAENFGFAMLLFLTSFFCGMMIGLFFAPANQFVSLLANNEEIKIYKSKSGYLNNILSVGLPLLSGILIHFFGFNSSFVMMLIISVCYLWMANKVPNVQVDYNIVDRKKIKETRYSSKMIVFLIVSVLILDFASITKTFLLFQLSSNELYLSYLNFANVITVTLCYWITIKMMRVEMGKQHIIYASAMIVSFSTLFIGGEGAMYFVAMTSIVASVYFYRYIIISISFQYINEYSGPEKLILLLKREFYLFIGRGILYFFAYLFVKDIHSNSIQYFSSISIFGVLLGIFYFKGILKNSGLKKVLA